MGKGGWVCFLIGDMCRQSLLIGNVMIDKFGLMDVRVGLGDWTTLN